MKIQSDTPLKRGERINESRNRLDFDDPVYAVATAAHVANSGYWLEVVMATDDAKFKYSCKAKTYTATGGSTTTIVDSSLVPQTDNFWIGGKVKIITCAADPTLNNTMYDITGSTGSSGTITIGITLPVAIASGDTYQICPGYMAIGYIGYDLDSDAMNIDFDAIGGSTLEIVDCYPEAMEVIVRFRQYAVIS